MECRHFGQWIRSSGPGLAEIQRSEVGVLLRCYATHKDEVSF